MNGSPPVTWDGLQLNPLAERPDGVLPVVEDVTGWYDTPDFDGHNVALVLADGAVRGPKTAAAREIVISGSAAGPPAALARFRDELVVRAASRAEAALTIPDAAGRVMTASVRCDGAGLKHTFNGGALFHYQVALTATDGKLYGQAAQQQLSLGGGTGTLTGWEYGGGGTGLPLPAVTGWRFPLSADHWPPPDLGWEPIDWSLVALAFSAAAPEPYYFWEWGNAAVTGASAVTVPFADFYEQINAMVDGDTAICWIAASAPVTITGVTDTAGNTWREVAVRASPDGTCDQHAWIAENVAALDSAGSVTVQASDAVAQLAGNVWTMRAAHAYLTAATANGRGTSPNLAMTVAEEAAYVLYSAGIGTGGPGPPYVIYFGNNGGVYPSDGLPLSVQRGSSDPLTLMPQAWQRTIACQPWSAASPWAALALSFRRGTQADPAGGGTDVHAHRYASGALDSAAGGASTDISPPAGTPAIPAGCLAVTWVAVAADAYVTVQDSQGNTWAEVEPLLRDQDYQLWAMNGDAGGNLIQVHAFCCDPLTTALGATDSLTVTVDLTVDVTPGPPAFAVCEAIGISDLSAALPREGPSLLTAITASGTTTTPAITVPFEAEQTDVLVLWASVGAAPAQPGTGTAPDWTEASPPEAVGASWIVDAFGPQTYGGASLPRTYPRKYAQTALPNAATLVNQGNVPAPVTAVYSGELAGSRLVDNATGKTIYLAPVAAGTQVTVDTETLAAYAPGGASRASYVLPGSVPLLLPPLGQATWTLYAAGVGVGHPAVELHVGVKPPAPLPGMWTFYADTIIGATLLGPVTCTAFTAQRILSGFGTGSVSVPSGGTSALPPERLLRLWSWRLWAHYAGSPVWCGVPTGITDDAGGTVSLTLTELPGYLSKRVIDTPGGLTYTAAEQTTIAAALAAPLADIGVPVVVQAGPGYARDAQFDYLGSTDRAQLLATFAQQLSAPEFRAEYYLDPGGLLGCRLRIAYPRVGADTGLGLVVPGTAAAYSGQWDSDRLRTRTYATGALPANAPANATAPVVVVDRPQPDLPRLDAVDDWQDVSVASVLTDRANTAAAQYASPVETLSGSVPAGLPALGSYAPGDDVAISITDPLLPGGLVTGARLTQMDIDAAAGTVALTCTTVLPPPRPRDTLIARLQHDRVQLARLSHRNLAPLGAQAEPGGQP